MLLAYSIEKREREREETAKYSQGRARKGMG
jgi:hypothetical protein